MKRPWLIAALGLIIGAAAFGLLYASRTAPHRDLEQRCGPDLAWLKQEFKLSDADFDHVRRLHEAYRPVCQEMCQRISLKSRELTELLQTANKVTPQIERALNQAAQLRKECQTEMLRHFFQVSQAMPPEQGRRYLAWIQAQTLTPTHQAMVPGNSFEP